LLDTFLMKKTIFVTLALAAVALACSRRGLRRSVGPGLLLLIATACSRHDDQTTITSAKVNGSSTPRENDALDAAKRWNAAMSQRDLTLIASVYGAHVMFLGVPLRHDQVVQVLSDAFVKDPSFTQSITDVKNPVPDRIEMKRTWVTTGKSHTDSTWLRLAREDGKLVVIEQGDPSSDARVSSQSDTKQEYCDGLAQRVVMSTDKARALVDVPRGPLQNGYANEVRVVAVTVIDHTTMKAVAIGWFDVVPQTGEVSDALGGETLKPNGDLVAQMRKCSR
jgi:hypothetical protein